MGPMLSSYRLQGQLEPSLVSAVHPALPQGSAEVLTNNPPHRQPEWEQNELWLLYFLLFQLLQISRKHHTGSQGKGCPDTTSYVILPCGVAHNRTMPSEESRFSE